MRTYFWYGAPQTYALSVESRKLKICDFIIGSEGKEKIYFLFDRANQLYFDIIFEDPRFFMKSKISEKSGLWAHKVRGD